MTTDRAKERIRKLLALAGDGAATEGEIENSLAAARRIMDDHHLSADDIEAEADAGPAAEFDADGIQMGREFSPGGSSKCARWEGALAQAVARTIRTVDIYQTRKSEAPRFGSGSTRATKTACYVFYGPAEDVAIAGDMFQQLRETIAAMAYGRYGGVYRGQGRSYAEGFAYRLLNRTTEADRQTATEQAAADPGTSIVLASRRNDIVKKTKRAAADWLRDSEKVKLSKGSSGGGGAHHSDAHSRGQRDGDNASMAFSRRGRIGGSGRKALA